MSHQHYSDKVKEMKSKRKMDSNGPERRSTSTGSPRSTEAKFTAPTSGLENVFFGRGNEFKDVVGELASYVTSLGFGGALVAAVAMTNLESPIFKKLKQPTVHHSSDYDEKILAYCMEEIEWDARVSEWKQNCVGIHSFLLKHTHPELRAYLQKADGRFGFSLGKNDVVKLLIMVRDMDYLKQQDEKEISMSKSGSNDDDLLGFKNDDLNVSEVRTRREKVKTHNSDPVETVCGIQYWDLDGLSACDVQISEADVRKENIVETTHVSLGTNVTTYFSLLLKVEELVVAVRDVTPATFEKVDVEVPEVNPAKGSTNDESPL